MTNDSRTSTCSLWCLAAMLLLGVGCADDAMVDPAGDAGLPITELDGGPTLMPPVDSGPTEEPDAGPEREYTFAADGDAIRIEADLGEDLREAFPGAASQRVDIDTANDTVLIRLLDGEGEPLRLFALAFEEMRDGSRMVEVDFPAELPPTCTAPRCVWDFEATPGGADPAGGPASDHLVFVESTRSVMTMGAVDGVQVAVEALFDEEGELVDRRRTVDQTPADWDGESTLAALGAMMSDLQDLLDLAGMNEPQAAGLGCKLGKVAGWVVTGAAVAACCAVGNVPGCVVCGGLGGGAAGLIGELC